MNRIDFINNAVNSVITQDHPSVEHLIIDACSTDGTLEFLSSYSHLTVVSEKDRGVYDGMNKGIRMARGEVIGLLNTDDQYESHIFATVMAFFTDHPEIDALSGGTTFSLISGDKREIILHLGPVAADNLLVRATIGIPAINGFFFRKSVFDRIGLFNLEYRFAADRELLLRFYAAGLKLASLDREVYQYCSHPGSMTIYDVWNPAMLEENLRLARVFGDRGESRPIRTACRRWERHYFLDIIGHFFRRLDIASGTRYSCQAVRRHWWWPFYFSIHFPARVIRYYLRKSQPDGGMTTTI